MNLYDAIELRVGGGERWSTPTRKFFVAAFRRLLQAGMSGDEAIELLAGLRTAMANEYKEKED